MKTISEEPENSFLKWAKEYLKTAKPFPTPKEGSFFCVHVEDEKFVFVSSEHKLHILSIEDALTVYDRFNDAELPEKHMTGYYNDPKWGKPPNRTPPPWLASVIKYYVEYAHE